MKLTTANRYFTLFTEANSQTSKPAEIAKIEMRIASVSANVEKYLERKVENIERTEKFTPDNGTGTKSVRLSAYPVEEIDTITVYETELTEGEFSSDLESGLISFAIPVERLEPLFERSIAVTYTGGMADDTADFIEKYPDIEMEVLTQVNFEAKRVADIAMKSVSNGQTTSQLNPYGFLDSLITVLDRYKKVMWA